MEQYVGLDVSLKETSICVLDGSGETVWQGEVSTSVETLARSIRRKAPGAVRIGLESGLLSTWLWHALRGLDLPVVCLDARHAKSALSMQVNKTDRNDATGLAQIVRTGWYREVQVKSLEYHRIRAKNNVAIESGRSRLKLFGNKQQRTEMLFQKKVASTAARERAETEELLANYELKKAEFEKGLAKVELKRAEAILAQRTIISPMAGIVTERMLSPGAFIYEQATLLTLAQIDPLNVEVYVPISAYGSIRKGMLGDVSPVEPVGGVYRAEVTIVDIMFDAASGTFGVRLELPNPEQQIPAGLICSVRFLPGAS